MISKLGGFTIKIYVKSNHGQTNVNYHDKQSKIISDALMNDSKFAALVNSSLNPEKFLRSVSAGISKYFKLVSKDGSTIELHHASPDSTIHEAGILYLITKGAHSYISNPYNQEKLLRFYGLGDSPAYRQGRKSKELDHTLHNRIAEDIPAKASFAHIIDVLIDNSECLLNAELSDISKLVVDALLKSDTEYVDKSHFTNLIQSKDFSKPTDVVYVDDEVANQLVPKLVELRKNSTSKMHKKSYDAIIRFIETNQTSRQELSDDYESGIWRHTK